jgi:RNase P subunit RPR2
LVPIGTITVERGRRAPGRRATMPEGYCVKCREKKEMKDAEQITMKNGRPAVTGTCPDCGTKIFKIGKMS